VAITHHRRGQHQRQCAGFFTFNNGGTLASTPYRVLTQGNLNGEFQAAATQDSIACVTGKFYNGGDNCTVEVTFAPTRPGPRVGAVQLIGANGTPIATGNLYGTGTAPLVTFSPPTQRVVGSGFNDPTIVAFDGSGDVFVTTPTNPAVSEVVAVNGVVSSTSTIVTVGGGFNNPYGVAVDGSGNIFVADTGNNAVKEIVAINGAVSPTSTVITVNSSFGSPTGVAVDKSGNVFVADAAGAGALYEIVRGQWRGLVQFGGQYHRQRIFFPA
jgi:large repetitive protein